MANPDKVAAVAELAQNLRDADGVVLTEYRGLTVKQLQQLRRSLGGSASYAVAKNTLTKIAAKDAGLELDESLLVGPTAIAFINGDVVEVAKGLRDFAKDNEPLVIKGGFLDGKALDAAEVKKLADLESREVLLSKLAGAMKGTLQGAVSLFDAPLAQTARLLGALESKRAQEAPEDAAPTDVQSEAGQAPGEESDVPVTEDTPTEDTATASAAVEAEAVPASSDAETEPASSDAETEPASTDEGSNTEG